MRSDVLKMIGGALAFLALITAMSSYVRSETRDLASEIAHLEHGLEDLEDDIEDHDDRFHRNRTSSAEARDSIRVELDEFVHEIRERLSAVETEDAHHHHGGSGQ